MGRSTAGDERSKDCPDLPGPGFDVFLAHCPRRVKWPEGGQVDSWTEMRRTSTSGCWKALAVWTQLAHSRLGARKERFRGCGLSHGTARCGPRSLLCLLALSSARPSSALPALQGEWRGLHGVGSVHDPLTCALVLCLVDARIRELLKVPTKHRSDGGPWDPARLDEMVLALPGTVQTAGAEGLRGVAGGQPGQQGGSSAAVQEGLSGPGELGAGPEGHSRCQCPACMGRLHMVRLELVPPDAFSRAKPSVATRKIGVLLRGLSSV